ncbi:MAG: carbohydrate-binding domain-containing protein [Clostridia bacterium]|nr:carbohydrate-binding domain-containing protein [Clostridia bacterium]
MKRTVLQRMTSALISLCMLLALMPAVMAGSYAVSITGVAVEDGAVSGASVTVTESGSYTLYAATYIDGTLSGVVSKDFTESGEVTFDESLAYNSKSQTLRVYAWNGMEPVSGVYEDEATGFTATFVTDDHVSVTVSDTKSFDGEVTENAASALVRDGDTGEIKTDGTGQVNFKVTLDEGYEISGISITKKTYNNLKKLDTDTFRVTQITADTTITITTALASDLEDNAITATFDTDEGVASITVSETDNFDIDTFVTENASSAIARDGDGGYILSNGDGQINFVVNLEEGYRIANVTATEGTYKNLKTPADTGIENGYRLTKVSADTTVTITTELIPEDTGDGIIHLDGDSIDATGVEGATVSGTTLTLAASDTAYQIEGTLTDGNIVVAKNAGDVTLEFVDDVSVTSSTAAAVAAKSGANITLTADSGVTASFTSAAKKAIDGNGDVIINGDGEIEAVTTSQKNAIGGDNITITGNGTVTVNSQKHGIEGATSVTISGNPVVDITSLGDGIRSDLAPSLATAEYVSGGTVTINGGTIGIKATSYVEETTDTETNVTTTETKTSDGIQADTLLAIGGGNITIDALGEALKASASSLAYLEDGTDQATTQTHPSGNGCIVITGGTVTAKAGEDGIKAVKGITVSGGTVTVTQALDGIQVKEIVYTDATETTVQDYIEGSINITNGTVNVTASEDGIQCGTGNIAISGGDITVKSTQDGIQAEYILNITGGTFDVTTNGGSPATVTASGDGNSLADPGYSCKGLKAANLIYVTGGDITLNTYDDAVHTNNTVQLLGGTFDIQAGDDGVHGDSYLIVNNTADINITKCYEGLEAAKVYMNGGSSNIYATDDGINAAGTQPTGNALDLGSDFTLSSYSLAANQPPSGDGGSTGFGNNPASTSSYGYLEINGGYIYVNNAQGDGIDANGSMVINGGVSIVDGATLQSEDGLDFDSGVTFNGGYVLTMTAGGMDSVSGSFSQKYLLYGFTSNGQGGFSGGKGGQQPGSGSTGSSLAAGNYCIVDSDGNVLCAFSRTKSSIQRVLFSSPSVNTSKTYYIKPLTVSGATATDSLYGTVDSSTYAFTLSSGCSVNNSGTSYTMTAN